MTTLKPTPLHPCHLESKARLTDFAGWAMPLHYGSQLHEHRAVREHAGLFDVSHMGIVDVEGPGALPFLRYVLANDCGRLKPGAALYSALLNEAGGVLDDLIAYHLGDSYRLVVNASTCERDLQWLRAHQAPFEVTLTPRRDLALLALQGPGARELFARVIGGQNGADATALRPFHVAQFQGDQGGWVVAATGYTGEDGFEIMLPATAGPGLWQALLAAGAAPAGLGARDTLRLEAGMNLYGHEMDETVSPFAANMGWTVAFEPERDFIGRAALQRERGANAGPHLSGLVMREPGVLRRGLSVELSGGATGTITSGGFSPTLNCSIALARLPAGRHTEAVINLRGREIKVAVVPPMFVRGGKPLI